MSPPQKENQNRSYSLTSSASFSVIEFPYKNLPIDDISNSTLVCRWQAGAADTLGYLPGCGVYLDDGSLAVLMI